LSRKCYLGVLTCWLTGERRVADTVDYRQKAGKSTLVY
jgi:hypothetical protein